MVVRGRRGRRLWVGGAAAVAEALIPCLSRAQAHPLIKAMSCYVVLPATLQPIVWCKWVADRWLRWQRRRCRWHSLFERPQPLPPHRFYDPPQHLSWTIFLRGWGQDLVNLFVRLNMYRKGCFFWPLFPTSAKPSADSGSGGWFSVP